MAKNLPTADARERARQIAAKQAKSKAKSNRIWLQLTVLAVVAAIIAVIAVVTINGQKNQIPEAGALPASANQYGGIVLTQDGITKDSSTEPSRDSNNIGTSTASYEPTPGTTSALPLGIQTADEAKNNGKPVHITIFQDFRCVHCAQFEAQYGETIKQLIAEGKVTLEIRNLTFLDSGSPTLYSARAANAAYAVANQVTAEQYLDFQAELFTHQATGGVTNQELIDIAAKHGADIKNDVDNNTWRPIVNVVNIESVKNGVSGTPTVFADGQAYNSTGENFTTWINTIIDTKTQN